MLARRAWPLALAAAGIVVTMVLFAADRSGALLVALGPFDITTGVVLGALGLVLRVFAVALPGIIVFATTDPTDLADALVQNARAPARFAIGALAAFRLVPLLARSGRCSRWPAAPAASTPAATRWPSSRLFASTAFALLVGALRRGGAAGGGDGRPRLRLGGAPHVRPPPAASARADRALLVGRRRLSAATVAMSVLAGLFRPLIG